MHLPVDGLGQTHATGFRQRLDPGRDIHRVPKDVGTRVLHVPQVDADPHAQLGGSFSGVSLFDVPLKIHRALDRVQGVREFDQQSISDCLDPSAPMDLQESSDQPFLVSEEAQSGALVLLGERRVPRDVREHDCGKTPRHDGGVTLPP